MKLNAENVARVISGDLYRLVFFYKGREFRLNSRMMGESEHLVISDYRGRIVYTEMVLVYELFAKEGAPFESWSTFLDHHIDLMSLWTTTLT